MNITRATILEKNIDNELWLKLVCAIFVKNSWLTKILQNFSLYKALTLDYPNISHL